MSVCTIVVTYNRYKLLTECLDALLAQSFSTDVLVIDNASNDGTSKRIEEDGYLVHPKISYRRLKENLGGTGGFYEGMKQAYENSYDYVWLMDDDAEPAYNALEILMDAIKKYPNYAAYAPTTYIGTKEEHTLSTFGHRGMFDYINTLPAFQQKPDCEIYQKKYAQIDMASFVGILVPKSSIDLIGLPRQEFFIHHDDTEYSLRLATLGKILLCNEGAIYHKEKRQEEKIARKFLWLHANRIRFEMLWLKYYGLRNSIYIALKYARTKKVYWDVACVYFELIKNILLYDDHKIKRIKFATHSVFDGIRGKFDNSKAKKILGVK